MPILGLLHFLFAIGFAVHAHRTGRPQFWFLILLMLPLVGSIAYVLFELLPEFASSRRARRVAGDIKTAIDPDGEWRRLGEQVRLTGTVQARCNFAGECERKGMWAEAIDMYQMAGQGMYAEDPDVMRGLARALLGAGEAAGALVALDRLRAVHPDYQSADAHLTYARALEALNRLDAAEIEYRALAGYFVGLEARTRYALLLLRLGEPEKAKRLFDDVVRAGKARGVVLTEADRQWLRVALKNQ
jgi:hypothetical protein